MKKWGNIINISQDKIRLKEVIEQDLIELELYSPSRFILIAKDLCRFSEYTSRSYDSKISNTISLKSKFEKYKELFELDNEKMLKLCESNVLILTLSPETCFKKINKILLEFGESDNIILKQRLLNCRALGNKADLLISKIYDMAKTFKMGIKDVLELIRAVPSLLSLSSESLREHFENFVLIYFSAGYGYNQALEKAKAIVMGQPNVLLFASKYVLMRGILFDDSIKLSTLIKKNTSATDERFLKNGDVSALKAIKQDIQSCPRVCHKFMQHLI